jgi:hypothetical protein
MYVLAQYSWNWALSFWTVVLIAIVLSTNSFQDCVKGLHTIYMDIRKKNKVTEDCVYLLNLARPGLYMFEL